MASVLQHKSIWNATVLVAALGYFVDIFDLILFGMVRTASLTDLGIGGEDLERVGLSLDNWQMLGMLLGGLFWGMLGDRRGRLSVLFGSIITYSIANIANGFVEDVTTYALLRFVAGFGLAGELGAGITLVSETLDKDKRGLAATLVASVGISGAVVGGFIVKWVGDWRICYWIGGGMGLLLLLLRINVFESGMFDQMKQQAGLRKGSFLSIFRQGDRARRYFACIALALPTWYVVQLYAKYSPELCEAVGLVVVDKKELAINAIMLTYFGIVVGDVVCGLLSNYWRSRRRALGFFLLCILLALALFWTIGIGSITGLYISLAFLGFAVGYWAVFMSITAESFGTNIRSTVTGTIPNFVRGSVILINSAYQFIKYSFFPGNTAAGTVVANLVLGLVVVGASFWGWSALRETYGKDLNYVEE